MTANGGVDGHRAAVRSLIDRQPDHPDLLRRLCLAAVDAFAACGCGISVMTADGTQGISATSDPVSKRVAELQFFLGEGPCIEAYAAGRPVLIADLSDAVARRWPVYAPAARGDGVRAVLAFPLQIGAARLGAARHAGGPDHPGGCRRLDPRSSISGTGPSCPRPRGW
ncbi:GAF domain-containing protein [Actinoplanes sp. NPDC026619]|uniref:GAF domain-containing protein n=1 Tax=Actinoplanes sp. NPDC026619 TaxID=3155798 RepID=UPI00340A2E78